jgi:hypothetical protein
MDGEGERSASLEMWCEVTPKATSDVKCDLGGITSHLKCASEGKIDI